MRALRNHLKKSAMYSGVLHFTKRIMRYNVNIMLYHGFCPEAHSTGKCDKCQNKFISVYDFEKHLHVYSKYTDPLSLEDLLRPRSLPCIGSIITIDDGYENNYSIAFPLLKKYNIPATIFVTTGFIDRITFLWTDWLEYLVSSAKVGTLNFSFEGTNFRFDFTDTYARNSTLRALKKQLKSMPTVSVMNFLTRLQQCLGLRYGWHRIPESHRPLQWEHIREMKASRLISFGSHTVSHPILSNCTYEQQQFEVRESKKRIQQQLGQECFAFAYPNGLADDYSPHTIEILKRYNYSFALTCKQGCNRITELSAFELKRWGSDVSTHNLAFLLSGASSFVNDIRLRV
jgi:peptidoglycan/xylan/chitin deacetylase (PgdA/CDA1 family)